VLKTAAPITLSLALGAAILWLLMGVASGILSAVRPRSFLDRFFTAIALFFYSLPTFVLGLLLLLFLYFDLSTKAHLHLFPAAGYVDLTKNPAQWAHHLILPWITLAVVSAAAYTRLTRSSMLDVMGEDYIRTGRAKGLTERRVILRHGLRAALTPIVTQFGIDVGVLIGGAVITETVFSMQGLGYTAVQAISNQDLPVILGIVIVASAAVVVANILVDIVYAVLDPRVRLS
jgi:peptide/nickel transport system permease protein